MINSQMRNDLQNYLKAKEREKDRERDLDDTSANNKNCNAGGGDGVALSPGRCEYPISKSSSVKSTLCSVTRSRVIKHIFDSDYVKPEENFRVYQETHPKRSAVLKDALERFEAQL